MTMDGLNELLATILENGKWTATMRRTDSGVYEAVISRNGLTLRAVRSSPMQALYAAVHEVLSNGVISLDRVAGGG